MNDSSIAEGIQAYQETFLPHEHARDRSWEHCYTYFRQDQRGGPRGERDVLPLQLGFYLASWGMYRGSSFLLQHAYTVHRDVVDVVRDSEFEPLRDPMFGSREKDVGLLPLMKRLVDAIRGAYTPFGDPTDTLVTKVILGTLGCLPACDTYFVQGCRAHGISYSSLNDRFLRRLLEFVGRNSVGLTKEQERLTGDRGIEYPFMKLVDMYLWEQGFRNRKMK